MKKTFLFFILLYQKLRLGFFTALGIVPTACRFDPNCSTYAYQAINKHGIIRGGLKALKRITSCHPLNSGGWDPA